MNALAVRAEDDPLEDEERCLVCGRRVPLLRGMCHADYRKFRMAVALPPKRRWKARVRQRVRRLLLEWLLRFPPSQRPQMLAIVVALATRAGEETYADRRSVLVAVRSATEGMKKR